ncbi:MAG TPA: phosphotransferase [Pontiellaceae bacterium]|nr:phosphotransferase [Pontiellaceae bacterium]
MATLDFILKDPSILFRAIRRKGELRYVASNRPGSLAAATRFAPPTKPLPKLFLRLGALVDFRLPGFAEPIRISSEFLEQAADRLQIPADRLGMYAGEPNPQQKLVVADVERKSPQILKLALGQEADAMIARELEALLAVDGLRIGTSVIRSPKVQHAAPVAGRSAMLIERIDGRQFSPKEFEAIFLNFDCTRGRGASLVRVGEWLDQTAVQQTQRLAPLLAACRAADALDLLSARGRVQGDFMSWNLMKTSADPVLIDWEFSYPDVPVIFDKAYAAYCYAELLGLRLKGLSDIEWTKLVALGALWKELRQQL